MNEKHLTYFKVENFKRFESFEMDNIGQFNLILGDNNVGKTSVLEALAFDEESLENYISNLTTILNQKDILVSREMYNRETNDIEENYLSFLINKNKKNESLKTTFAYKDGNIQKMSLMADTEIALFENYTEEYKKFYKSKAEDDFSYRLYLMLKLNDKTRFMRWQALAFRNRNRQPLPIIFFAQTYESDLLNFYFDYVQKDGKDKFIETLKLFIPTIKDIEPTKLYGREMLAIREIDNSFMPLSMYGDGVNRLVRILLQLPACKGKRLMIDEIDAGVHFKKFKDFWRNILLAAKQNDVQVFATTHNTECLQAFKEVLEETEMIDFQQDARCFELLELLNKKVKAYTLSYEEFAAMIETKTNIRGGNYQNV
jgi:AAA15 family ATPase/GTPase